MTQWINGIPDDYGYARYGNSPYYTVPEGWEILVEDDWGATYEFEMIVVWRNQSTGELRAAADSGCSCPTPFSDLTLEGMLVVHEVDDLKPLVDLTSGAEWDAPNGGVADIKAKVHRALRGG